ncbi:MAG TPA: hypothetical protein VGO68_13945, partial [Pyrinomonadaceae bacterium]|nr:hypothetical protein [Pyrinomonadaceae bacterium]
LSGFRYLPDLAMTTCVEPGIRRYRARFCKVTNISIDTPKSLFYLSAHRRASATELLKLPD